MQSSSDYRKYFIPAASSALAAAQTGIGIGYEYAKSTLLPKATRIASYAFGERALGYAIQQKAFKATGVYGSYNQYPRQHVYRYQNLNERVQDWARRREYRSYTRSRGYRRYQQKYKRYHRRYHRYYEDFNKYL